MVWFKNTMKSIYAKFKPISKRWQFGRLLIVLFLTSFLVMSVYLVVVAKTAQVKNLQATLSNTAVVIDDSGAKAGELYSQKGSYVQYDHISQNMRDAVI